MPTPNGRPASLPSGTAVAAGLALALPWLTPVANGPSTGVQPWLFAAGCAAVLGALARHSSVPPSLAWAGGALCAWAMLRTGVGPETVALAGAVAVIALAAAFARPAGGSATPLLASAWLGAAVLSTAIGLAQYFGVEEVFGPLASRSAAGDAYANLRQRNQFATLTAIGIAAACWEAARAARVRPWMWLAVAWLAAGNAATTSRTGLLELVVLFALTLIWSRGSASAPVRLTLFALAAYLAASWVLPSLHESLLSGVAPSIWARAPGGEGCSSRAVLWSNVLHLVAQKPWAGWGWGELDFAHYATLFEGPRFCDILDNAHNLPLHIAVELGLPAALALMAVLVRSVLKERPWAETGAGRQLAWSVLAVIALHSLLEYPLWYGPFQLAAGAAMGLLAHGSRVAGRPLRLTSPLSLVLGVAVCYAAWDYRRVSQIFLPPQERALAYREDTGGKALRSWLFHPQAAFAQLSLSPLTASNAQWTWEQSQALLHYSPEPGVVEKAIESATLLQRERDAVWHLARFQAAFPRAHADWAQELHQGPPILPAR